MFHVRNVSALLLLLVNLVSGFCVGIDVYIPYRKYQVKPHSSPLSSAAKLHMPIKQNCLSLPRTLTLATFGKLPMVFAAEVNMLYLLHSTQPEVLSSASNKVKLFTENFSKNSNLHDSGSLYLFFLLKLI